MSGFEAAIRNALVRSSSGAPEARQRVYAAARASLERNLQRVNADDATATAQRQKLETTIDAVEGEWMGASASQEGRLQDRSIVPSGSPSVASNGDPITEIREGLHEPHMPAVSPTARINAHGTSGAAVSVPPVPLGHGTSPATQARADVPDLPAFERTPRPRPRNETRLEGPPPDEIDTPRRNRDPFFDDRPAAKAEGNASVSATADEDDGVATPHVEPRADVPSDTIADPDEATTDPADPIVAGVGETDEASAAAPAVLVEGQGPNMRTKRTRKRGRASRKEQRSAEKQRRRELRKTRRPFRIAALLLIVAVAVGAYVLLESAGLLEAQTDRPAPITVANGPNQPPAASRSAGDWVEVLNVSDAASAVEADRDSARIVIDAPTDLELDLSGLNGQERVRLAIALRAQSVGRNVAFTCEGALSCGRQRFVAPREVNELIFEVDRSLGGEPRVRVDPTIAGEAGTIEIFAVRALGL